MNAKEEFSYSYKPLDQDVRKEVLSIKEQYSGQKKALSKVERLRKLDAKVKNPALIWSLVLGIVGILMFGVGMTIGLEMDRLGNTRYILASIIGALSIIPMGISYPLYKKILEKKKQKYKDEIIKLSDEILAEER